MTSGSQPHGRFFPARPALHIATAVQLDWPWGWGCVVGRWGCLDAMHGAQAQGL